MSTAPRGRFLDHSLSDLEATEFARSYGLTRVDRGDAAPDPKLHGYARRVYALPGFPRVTEVEVLTGPEGKAEVVGLWLDRRWMNDRAQLPKAVGLYAAFLVDAIGAVDPADVRALGDYLSVGYELQKTFEPLLDAFPFTPRNGLGAATETFLGKRMEGTQTLFQRHAQVIVRNDESGRLYVGVATQAAAFDLGAMLFHAAATFTKGERAGIVGWKTPEIESTPFGRRFHLELDRAAPPRGRIARRYYGLARIPRSAVVEVLLEPTRGLAGVLLRVEQEWLERADTNYFAALELLASFIAEGLGDAPDARARVLIGEFLSATRDDADLLKIIQGSLPFVTAGETGEGLAVFLGEAETAAVFFDENRCGLMLHENADGWLDCMYYLTEFAEDLEVPAAARP